MDLYVIWSISGSTIYLRSANQRKSQSFSTDIAWVLPMSSSPLKISNLQISDILKYNTYYYAIPSPNRFYKTLDYAQSLGIPKHIYLKFPVFRNFSQTWPEFMTIFTFSLVDYGILQKKPQILNSLRSYLPALLGHLEYFNNKMHGQGYVKLMEDLFLEFDCILELSSGISSYFGNQYERLCSIMDVSAYFIYHNSQITIWNPSGTHKIHYYVFNQNYFLIYDDEQALKMSINSHYSTSFKVANPQKKLNEKTLKLENSKLFINKMLECYQNWQLVLDVLRISGEINIPQELKTTIKEFTSSLLCFECQQPKNLVCLPCTHKICLNDFTELFRRASSGKFLISEELTVYCNKSGCGSIVQNRFIASTLPDIVRYSCSKCKEPMKKSEIHISCGHLCDSCAVDMIRSKKDACLNKNCNYKLSHNELSYFRELKKTCEGCEESFYWVKCFTKKFCKHLLCIECISETRNMICFWKCPAFNITPIEFRKVCIFKCSRCTTWIPKKNFFYLHKNCECELCTECQLGSKEPDLTKKCSDCKTEFNEITNEYLTKQKIDFDKQPETACGVCQEKFKSCQLITLIDCEHNFCKRCFNENVKVILKDSTSIEKIQNCFACQVPIRGNQLQAILDPDDFEKWIYFTLTRELNLTQCPSCKNEFEFFLSRKVICPNNDCKFEFCKNCKEQFHETGDCEEIYFQEKIKELEAIDEEGGGVTQCPSCRTPYLKSPTTCQHVDCLNPNCNASFCFKCACIRSPTVAHGNHYHRPQCEFFNEYDGDDDEYDTTCTQCQKLKTLCTRPKNLRVERRVAFDEIEI